LDSGASAVVVTHFPNILYLSGFTGSAGILLVELDRATLFTDGRYAVQAPQQVKLAGIRVVIPPGSILKAAGVHIGGLSRRARHVSVGFDPVNLTVAQHKEFRRSAGSRASWLAASGWVEDLRLIKSDGELLKMRAAARLISKVFEQVFPLIRPGVTELDLSAEIDYRMRKLGASGPSFETIVASGPRAALPHASPTSRRLRRNELVVLDAGAILADYCSDMTRTVCIGEPSEKLQKMFDAVLAVQELAEKMVKPGASCKSLQEAAETYFVEHGYETSGKGTLFKYAEGFVHSLGHGVGKNIHEVPHIRQKSEEVLMEGDVITIEPGLYYKDLGGIRMEDMVLVTENGCRNLTRSSKEFVLQ